MVGGDNLTPDTELILTRQQVWSGKKEFTRALSLTPAQLTHTRWLVKRDKPEKHHVRFDTQFVPQFS